MSLGAVWLGGFEWTIVGSKNMTMACMIEEMLSWLYRLEQKEAGTDPRGVDATKKMLRDQTTERRLFAWSVRASLAKV